MLKTTFTRHLSSQSMSVREQEAFSEFTRRTKDGRVRIVFAVRCYFTGRACLLQHARRFQYAGRRSRGEVILTLNADDEAPRSRPIYSITLITQRRVYEYKNTINCGESPADRIVRRNKKTHTHTNNWNKISILLGDCNTPNCMLYYYTCIQLNV